MGKPATSRTCHLCFQQLQRDNLNNLTSTSGSGKSAGFRRDAQGFPRFNFLMCGRKN